MISPQSNHDVDVTEEFLQPWPDDAPEHNLKEILSTWSGILLAAGIIL